MEPEEESNAPHKIEFSSHVVDLALHPSSDVVAAAEVDGRVSIFTYSQEGNQKKVDMTHHTDSVRTVTYSNDGKYLFTGSLDKSMSMIDLTTGQLASHVPNVHDAGVSCIHMVDQALCASGDDDGVIKLWDLRSNALVKKFHESEDFISDMRWVPESHSLLATSGDGALSVFDLNAKGGPTMDTVSDYMEEELLSLEVIKGQTKVVCGTQDGVLGVFKWGQWADVSDRVPGHPSSVESILKLDEDTIITGSSDGLIRIMQLYPNKLLGVVGDHDEFPIEKIAMSHDRHLLASCSHDSTVQFWDIKFLTEDDGEDDEGEDDDEAGEDDDDEAMDGGAGGDDRGEQGGDFFGDL